MKAFVAKARGQYEVTDIPMPECGDSDILVRVKTGAICGSDVHIYHGDMDPLCGFPIIMGHENAGVVEKVGPNAPGNFKVGDRVTSENTVTVCGTCYSCLTGDYVACEKRTGFGVAADGCFAEYYVIPGKLLAQEPMCLMKIPDNVTFEQAPLMEPAANAYKTVFQEGELMAGENVIISGVGAFGAYCAHMASIGGAAHIAVVVRKSTDPRNIEAAKKMGATDVLYSDEPEAFYKACEELTGGFGFDLAVETAGSGPVLNMLINAVHTHGRVVRISINNTPYNFGLDNITLRSIQLKGHLGYNPISWRNVMNLAEAGKLDLDTVVTHTFPLDQAKEAFDLVVARKASKVILKIEE